MVAVTYSSVDAVQSDTVLCYCFSVWAIM